MNDLRAHYASLPKSGGPLATPETVQLIIEEAAKFAENELAPINEGGDRVGCKQTGPNTVVTPPGFKAAYDQFVAGGWQVRAGGGAARGRPPPPPLTQPPNRPPPPFPPSRAYPSPKSGAGRACPCRCRSSRASSPPPRTGRGPCTRACQRAPSTRC